MKKLPSGFVGLVILLVVGLIVGIGITFAYFQLKTGPTTQSQTTPSEQQDTAKSTPQQSTVSNKIAFVEGDEVVIKNLDTEQEFKTGIPINWQDPNATWCQGFDWSPDGTKIFATVNGGSIYDLTTQSLKPIPNFPTSISSFEWNSNSQSLFLTATSTLNNTQLYQLSSGSISQISTYPMNKTNLSHSVSYDGKKIVLSKNSGQKDQYGNLIQQSVILDLKSGQETALILPGNVSLSNPFVMDVAWSPNNDQVAYVYTTNVIKRSPNEFYRHIGIFSLKSKTSMEFSLPDSSVRNPVYSPNGEYFIFENESAPQELWIANKDGSSPKKIADKPVDFYKSPSWLPDNKRITFNVVGGSVYTVEKDGTNKKVISSNGSCPIASPR